MSILAQLARPVIAAPMAGGPTTPELVCATHDFGGLGFLAAGYLTPDQLLAQIEAVESVGARFGVNLFVPEIVPADQIALAGYRRRLAGLAGRFAVDLPRPHDSDDHWEQKVQLLLEHPVPVVSFTFGCPDEVLVSRLHRAGTQVFVTVTRARDAVWAASVGADALIVQGPEAGGHRSTFRQDETPDGAPLLSLLATVREHTDLPLIAAGGLSTRSVVEDALTQAVAVQLGTALLRADEAGTSPAHRQALDDARFSETTPTRCFTGRVARSLRNTFIAELDEFAPAAYPQVHQLTGPIRKAAAAAGDLEYLHLWAGTGWRDTGPGAVAEILGDLIPSRAESS